MNGGQGLGAAVETHGRPGAGAQFDIGMLAGGLHQLHHVIPQHRVHVHLLHQALQLQYFLALGHRAKVGQGVRTVEPNQHLLLLGLIGIPHSDPNQEPV